MKRHITKKKLIAGKPLRTYFEIFINTSDHAYALTIRRRIKKYCGYDLKIKKMAR